MRIRHVKKTARLLDKPADSSNKLSGGRCPFVPISAIAGSGEPAVHHGVPGAVVEPCASCGVRCCNRFAVPITGFDVVRIMEATGRKPPEFAQLAPAQNIESAPHTPAFIFEEGQMEERLLSLHRLKNNYCTFSLHSSGCSIWGHHPLVCKTYPFVVDDTGRLKYTKNFVCPRKWEKHEYDERRMLVLGEQMNAEIEEYNKLVRKWNATQAKKGDEAGFWKFLIRESKEWMKKNQMP